MTDQNLLSASRINRLRVQGYTTQSPLELSQLAFGNRFAYRICTALLVVGVATANTPLLSFMLVIAALGVLLPNHPFDYIYNQLLAKRMNKPKLPKRSKQLKFACAVATLWIAATIYLFTSGFLTTGYVMGSILIGIAFTVSTTDFCLPSVIYNTIFLRNTPLTNPKTQTS